MKRTIEIFWLLSIITVPCCLTAQLISVKTVPLATGEQFHVFPSQNFGMAGVSIAVDDPLLDPFINPAKGAIHDGSHLIFAPVSYKISGNESPSRTLPLTVIFNKNRWFFTSSISVQELNLGRDQNGNTALVNKKLKNSYFYGSYGRRLGDGRTFLAGGLYWADLSGIDGVEHLYSDSRDIRQSGEILDFRLGFLKYFQNENSFEALLIYNRSYMEHERDFLYPYYPWDDYYIWPTEYQTTEYDHTNTWGLQLGYVRPFVQNPTWKLGFDFTVNYKSHPKIPNYDLMHIPRDPGNTWAYNLGIGLSRNTGKSVFGVDLIYEPIRSNTWAIADEYIRTESGKMINKGNKTINNHFNFSNAIVRIGFTAAPRDLGIQLGAQIHSIHYAFNQHNYVEEIQHKWKEDWLEWTVSWGLFYQFADYRLSYMGRLINGTGWPGVDLEPIYRAEFNAYQSDFIIAPAGHLTLDEEEIILHQIVLSIPL